MFSGNINGTLSALDIVKPKQKHDIIKEGRWRIPEIEDCELIHKFA